MDFLITEIGRVNTMSKKIHYHFCSIFKMISLGHPLRYRPHLAQLVIPHADVVAASYPQPPLASSAWGLLLLMAND